jgi:hypothetical protein
VLIVEVGAFHSSLIKAIRKKYLIPPGPYHPNEHYMLPTQKRYQGLLNIIEQKQYFVIHAVGFSFTATLPIYSA